MREKAPSSVGDLKLHNSLAFLKTVLATEFSSGTAPCNLTAYRIPRKNYCSGSDWLFSPTEMTKPTQTKHPA